MPNPPSNASVPLLVNASQTDKFRLIVSLFTTLFLPVPSEVVRVATPNPGWQVDPETLLVAEPLSSVMATVAKPFPASLPVTLPDAIVRHEHVPLGHIAE